jgi:DNA mismatch repair protein MutL
MAHVTRLSPELANQIAAGEVVERPASVVKELLENAMDAGASRIRVDLEGGGLGRIRVTDDGEGMERDDALLALERHATSKIRVFDDLTTVTTFGFRGEALPSIASVSRFTLSTRTRASSEGTEIRVENDQVQVRPTGCAPGTIVDVADIFFNVPARRKFLKQPPTEAAQAGEAVLLAALSCPGITLILARDGKVAREFLRVETRSERALQAFPNERLEACGGPRGPMHIDAYLGAPERARTGATALYIFVNQRPVKDRRLARAVAQAYGSVLEPGRYPIGVVYVDLAPELVDVNVHPQKAEVRFADGAAVYDAVTRVLHGALAQAYAVPALGPRSAPWLPPIHRNQIPLTAAPTPTFQGPTPTFQASMETYPAPAPAALVPLSESDRPTLTSTAPPDTPKGFYGALRYLAQARSMFLVCEGDDGLYLLDQHAAAERVTFHRLRQGYHARTIAMQTLLLAELVELSPAEVAVLDGQTDALFALGVELRAVGTSAVAVHGVPKLLAHAHPERLVRDLVAELGRMARRPFGEAADMVLATMACHGSLRAGDRISSDEAMGLLRALDEVDFAGHCPHGRPVVTRIAFDELERRVGR